MREKKSAFDPARSDFIISIPRWKGEKVPDMPIVVAAGRSNVGKSSFINLILRRKNIARTSSTPGRTQLLNFFEVDSRLVLADVPGYGFAKAPKGVVETWTRNVRDFIQGAERIGAVLQLLDVRRDPTGEDKEFARMVREAGRPLIHVVTKSDKLPRGRRAAQVRQIAKAMGVSPGDMIVTSATEGEGRKEVWARLLALLNKGAGDEK